MKIKRNIEGAFYKFCKTILPRKYYDSIYIAELIRSKNLKGMKPLRKLWCFMYGFLPYEYIWYDLEKNDYRNYVSSRSSFQNRLINGSFNAILSNKILFEKHIKSVISGIEKLHVVESIGYIEGGFLFPFNKEIISDGFSLLKSTLDKNDIILKPVLGDGGVGVKIIIKDVDQYIYDNKKMRWEELVVSLKKLNNYLLQKKFIQSGLSHDIYPVSVNTMRIGTMIDHETHQPFIGYAIHRFGSDESGFIDNINQGGLASFIDLDTGTLGEGMKFSLSGEKYTYMIHPLSSSKIINKQIPDWLSVKKRLTEMAGRMPYLKYVGWDIILSDGELYILEGNVSPGLGLVQAFKPMSEFPAAWKFFKYYKYVT